jgi:serine protease Do
MNRTAVRGIVLASIMSMILVACGGSGEEATTTIGSTTSTTATTLAPTTTTTAEAVSGAVGTLADVKGATVRIVAQGTFVDPEFGTQLNSAGSGSGFIIDPAGIAVTNNHVVTGAAFLQVYVGGETDPRNARVLGVSECSDLAVIDIDGDGYPYLDWFDGDVTAGMDIYAIGFPLGTEEYTVLDGIVSKENAGGESTWSSVDSVIEHSADILPGNSGGPVVTGDGAVVAVTYAGDSAGQSYAIGREEAGRVLDQLVAGTDVTSLGLNGQAIVGDGLSGIWVASVESGSPAQEAGIEAGDIVTLLEGLALATDGTMADYCDILRSHGPGDPLAVEIYRSETGEFLDGILNSGEELEVAFSFGNELDDEITDSGVDYSDYMEITDETESLFVDVPVSWTDTTSGIWNLEGADVGIQVLASPDLDGYFGTWETPGIFFGASSTLGETWSLTDLLDYHGFPDACIDGGRDAYDDGLYFGQWDVWDSCGGTDSSIVNVAAAPEDGSFVVLVQMQVVTDADLDALDQALATFIAFLDS